jgi:transposase-like protein
MPWKECRAMSQKLEFVERAAKGEAIASLCREYGVSRQTGHKWVKRFRERGYEGLEEESRRPKSVPLATAEELVMATLRARDEHARWGPIKLRVVLQRRFGEQAPSQRTIDDQTRLRSERNAEKNAPTMASTSANILATVAPEARSCQRRIGDTHALRSRIILLSSVPKRHRV